MNWKEFIQGYSVSESGEVRNDSTGKLRKPQKRRTGADYLSVIIRGKNFDIHRLVATYFLDNLEAFTEVRHIDSDPENNHYTNLAWGTHEKNINDALVRGSHTSQVNESFKQQQNKANKPSKVKRTRTLPIGVSEKKQVKGTKYIAKMGNQVCGQVYLGSYKTPDEAFEAVKVWYLEQYGISL